MWEGNRLKLFAGFVTICVIAPAMFLLFRFLFTRLVTIDDSEFGIALSSRLLSSAFMAFSVFLAISSMISGISTLYRSRETTMLLSLPVGSAPVAVFRIFESWFYAGWSTLLLGLPVILAFASVVEGGTGTAIMGMLLLVPLILASTASGTVLTGLFSRLGGMGLLRRGAAGVVIGAALALILYFQGARPGAVVIPDSSAGSLDAVHRFVAGLPATGHSIWPHALFGEVVGQVAGGGSRDYAMTAAAILTAEALLAAIAALLLTAPGFRARHSRIASDSGGSSSSRRFFRRGGLQRAVLEKDLLLFVRDPVQLSQLALLAGLFLMYASSLSRFPVDFSQRMWLGVAVFMNVSFSGFVMATLLVRFAFPLVSLEGPAIPFVLQMPGARRRLLRSKWTFAIASVLPLMLLAGLLSSVRLGAWNLFLIETLGSIVLMSFALSSINTALGAVFPSFSDNSPASIASGQGGIIAAFASMGYVLSMVTALSYATRAYLVEGFRERAISGPLALTAVITIPLTVLVSVLSMRGALRSFSRRDF